MRILVLGDIHGRNLWRRAIDQTKYDLVVFVGDYFDSHEGITAKNQIDNFQSILELKQRNLESTILLTGNHDYHYLSDVSERYSGFQSVYKQEIGRLIDVAYVNQWLQMAFEWGQYLFSHAGISKTWLSRNKYDEAERISDFVNSLFYASPASFRFQPGPNNSKTGDDICQPPIWIRPTSLLRDGPAGVIQVVGHTIQEHINLIDHKLLLTDALGTSQEYVILSENSWETYQVSI